VQERDRAGARRAGRDPDAIDISLFLFCSISPDRRECLDDCRLRELYFYASELGMESLIEIYEPDNLDRVLKLSPALLGINNRNLRTFETRLETTLDLLERIPEDRLVITESGISAPRDVALMRQHGVNAFLVGEAFMRSPDPGVELARVFDI
jgi:indole-3-glycerol phosphate synthase